MREADTKDAGALGETVVSVYRSSKVMKGGRRFSFAGLVVVGDGEKKVGWGYGKANQVAPAIEKAMNRAKAGLVDVPLVNGTIPHPVVGRFGASKVIMLPAAPGTGVIAGAPVRAVCERAGIHNILTKSLGSNNGKNLVKAVFNGLAQLQTRDTVQALRGVKL